MRKTIGIICLIAAGLLYADQRGWIDVPIPSIIVEDENPKVPAVAADDDGFYILIIHSSEELSRLSRSQLEAIQGTRLKAWMNDHKAKWRIWDSDQPGTFDEEWFNKAKQIERDSLPWLVIRHKKKAYSGKLGENFEEITNLMSKYSG